jgi:hypothetical protein
LINFHKIKQSITFETSNTHCGVLKLADKPSGLGGGESGKKPDKSGLTAPWRFESFPYSHTCKLSKKPWQIAGLFAFS